MSLSMFMSMSVYPSYNPFVWHTNSLSLSFLHSFPFFLDYLYLLSIPIFCIRKVAVWNEPSSRTLCPSHLIQTDWIHIFQTDTKSPPAYARNERPSPAWNRQEMFSPGSWWDTSTQLFPSTFDPTTTRIFCCISIRKCIQNVTPLHLSPHEFS